MALKKKKATSKVKAKKPVAKKTVAKKTASKSTARKTVKPSAKTARKTTTKAKTSTGKVAPKKTTAKKTAKRTTSTKSDSVPASKSLSLPKSAITQKQTKAQIINDLHETTGASKAEIKNIFTALRNIVERHMNPRGSGQFAIPEVGIKTRRITKKATKARMGRNPFTGEEIKIPAKPARKAIRATVLKSLKEVV